MGKSAFLALLEADRYAKHAIDVEADSVLILVDTMTVLRRVGYTHSWIEAARASLNIVYDAVWKILKAMPRFPRQCLVALAFDCYVPAPKMATVKKRGTTCYPEEMLNEFAVLPADNGFNAVLNDRVLRRRFVRYMVDKIASEGYLAHLPKMCTVIATGAYIEPVIVQSALFPHPLALQPWTNFIAEGEVQMTWLQRLFGPEFELSVWISVDTDALVTALYLNDEEVPSSAALSIIAIPRYAWRLRLNTAAWQQIKTRTQIAADAHCSYLWGAEEPQWASAQYARATVESVHACTSCKPRIFFARGSPDGPWIDVAEWRRSEHICRFAPCSVGAQVLALLAFKSDFTPGLSRLTPLHLMKVWRTQWQCRTLVDTRGVLQRARLRAFLLDCLILLHKKKIMDLPAICTLDSWEERFDFASPLLPGVPSCEQIETVVSRSYEWWNYAVRTGPCVLPFMEG